MTPPAAHAAEIEALADEAIDGDLGVAEGVFDGQRLLLLSDVVEAEYAANGTPLPPAYHLRRFDGREAVLLRILAVG